MHLFAIAEMLGDVCVVCGNTRAEDRGISMHRIPRNPTKREKWIDALGLDEGDLSEYVADISRMQMLGTLQTSPLGSALRLQRNAR